MPTALLRELALSILCQESLATNPWHTVFVLYGLTKDLARSLVNEALDYHADKRILLGRKVAVAIVRKELDLSLLATHSSRVASIKDPPS
jgi:hypothetical protein